MNQECPICVLKYNKTTRLGITCPDPQCSFTCCRECIKTYIVTEKNDPKCMSCSKNFTRMFLQNNFTQQWIKNEFKQTRGNVLFERQQSLIPETMPWVKAETDARKIEKNVEEINAQIRALNTRMVSLNNERDGALEAIRHLRYGNIPQKEQKKFIVRCPECPAFLEKNWKCSACGIKVCKHCREKIVIPDGFDPSQNIDNVVIILDHDDEYEPADNVPIHRCNPDSVAATQMIKNDTKPCPKCGNPIHKIEGCDQMFDPHCGTAFSWKTGQIFTGVIHNPHYFEWQRQNGSVARTPGDVPCGGVPTIADITDSLGWLPSIHNFKSAFSAKSAYVFHPAAKYGDKIWTELKEHLARRYRLIETVRMIQHIEHVEMPRLETRTAATAFRTMRVKYVLNEVRQDEFERELTEHERQSEKQQEIFHVWQTFCQLAGELLREFVNSITNSEIEMVPLYDVMEPNINHNYKVIRWWIERFEHTDGVYINRLHGTSSRAWSKQTEEEAEIVFVRKNGQYIEPSTIMVPNSKNVDEIYNNLLKIQEFCNARFCEISKSWKLVTPEIRIDNHLYGGSRSGWGYDGRGGDTISTKKWWGGKKRDV